MRRPAFRIHIEVKLGFDVEQVRAKLDDLAHVEARMVTARELRLYPQWIDLGGEA